MAIRQTIYAVEAAYNDLHRATYIIFTSKDFFTYNYCKNNKSVNNTQRAILFLKITHVSVCSFE